MSNSLHRLLSVVFVSAALAASGCKPPPSRVNFNNDMAATNKKMGDAAIEFRKALYPSADNQPVRVFDPDKVDKSRLQSAQSKMKKLLESAASDYEDATLPRKSSAAETLLDAYQNYLAAQKEIMAKADKIVAVLSDGKLGKDEKKNQVEGLVAEIKAIDEKAYLKLGEAQKSYCDAHFFKLVEKLE